MKNQIKIFSVAFIVFAVMGLSVYPNELIFKKPQIFNKVNLNKPLEAVLIVGNTEKWTASSIKDMNALGLIFENQGIKTTKFYDRNTNWEAIKRVAKTASFFVYSGHGSTMGINGKTGGLCLNQMISTKQILEELKLKKNAIVLFKSVCGGAGSSADDSKDIGIEEATTRVTDYAQPFFTIGATCYYADNYEDGIHQFLTHFLDGMTTEECYTANTQHDYVCSEISKPFALDRKKQIAISSAQPGGMTTQYLFKNGKTTYKRIPSFKNYDIAFVGNPDFTFEELTGLK